MNLFMVLLSLTVSYHHSYQSIFDRRLLDSLEPDSNCSQVLKVFPNFMLKGESHLDVVGINFQP